MISANLGGGGAVTGWEQPAARDWTFPRSAAAIAVLLAGDHGVPAERLLRGTGLGVAELSLPDREITADQELRVVRSLLAAVGDRPGVGLAVGGSYHLSSFGIFGYGLLASATVFDAMNFALRFIDLSFTFALPRAEVAGEVVRVVVDDTGVPSDVRRFLVERDLAAIHGVLQELVPGGMPVRRAETMLPGSDDGAGAWRAAIGVVPRFGASRHALAYDTAYLTRRLPLANPATAAMCEALCADLVARRRARGGLTQQVKVLLSQRVGSAMPEVADALGLSVRTLRRRLREEQTSFQRLLDEVRAELAERLLADPTLSLDDVALRLGYAEASSFILAFRRWRGTTPARWRDRRPAPGGAPGPGGRRPG